MTSTLRSHLVTAYYDTLGYCFDKVVQQMGGGLHSVVYDTLRKNGIPQEELSVRFDHVMDILAKTLGNGARVIVFQTVRELYTEYSVSPSFGYDSSMHEVLTFLREKVLADHLTPRHGRLR